jgi:VanZ family protein
VSIRVHPWQIILVLWGVLIVCVIVGSLLPAKSPAIVALGTLHISDKILHFCAYLLVALLPAFGFRNPRQATRAALSMLILGFILEALQHFSPGRAVEFGDLVANTAGVTCGILLARFFPPCPSVSICG